MWDSRALGGSEGGVLGTWPSRLHQGVFRVRISTSGSADGDSQRRTFRALSLAQAGRKPTQMYFVGQLNVLGEEELPSFLRLP